MIPYDPIIYPVCIHKVVIFPHALLIHTNAVSYILCVRRAAESDRICVQLYGPSTGSIRVKKYVIYMPSLRIALLGILGKPNKNLPVLHEVSDAEG